MTEAAIFAGPALRRLRKREGLTQSAMAARLGISASYLNLIERNQRPLSANVIIKIVDAFDFDPRALREDESIGGLDGLARRMADERFADLGIDREELQEFLAAAPQAAAAFARLYDNTGPAERRDDPTQAARREIERWRNHFADLDTAAEGLADELRLSRADTYTALAERLRERHQLAIRILPRDVLPDTVRRLDLHARQLQINEMLDPASRTFQLATQIALLEFRDQIRAIAAGAQFADETPRRLFERHVTSYAAAALVMPYGRFLRACDSTGYDLPVLMRRFGVGFESLAHRLTTLQRVGQRGLPFFMARIDRAGQFSKRYSGASGAAWLESDASCPLWRAHRAFERAGEICVQTVLVDGSGAAPAHWFTLARTVEGRGNLQASQFVVALGIEARLAGDLAPARGVSLRAEDAVLIGRGCADCHVAGCLQRSLPPRGTALQFSPVEQGMTPFRFAG
ncbi:short-chain fatty acyl-CoA regulator family protein [Tsuneonella sp. YG55]|uniref:Short-chain fatty acyl-CoA regulator family protein n=1 Tax=Tsuneonella litorea TaxID=2976475 RepID=A0A9X3AMA0_9SPHN|nr:helix-turn-helix transcriptional regulator [Tsuneonella litorea]MCT2558107.1 short-chain fatty acyl-CoA regulator family protein [Tsuneonella litorea]